MIDLPKLNIYESDMNKSKRAKYELQLKKPIVFETNFLENNHGKNYN